MADNASWQHFVPPMPAAVNALADHPSLLPRTLIATVRALGIGAAATVVAGGAALAWGQVERRWPVVRRYQIPVRRSTDVVRQMRPLTLLHLSDLHLFPGQEFLVDFLNRVARTEHFDAVISTGDNFGAGSGLDVVRAAYQPFLNYPGAFVLGSNDYYAASPKPWSSYLLDHFKNDNPTLVSLPWRQMVAMFEDAGWVDLSNQTGTVQVSVAAQAGTSYTGQSARRGHVQDEASAAAGSSGPAVQAISFVGVDDPHIQRDRVPAVAQDWSDPAHFRVAVTHAPYGRVLDAFARFGPDVIMAGHTHGGQIAMPLLGAIITNSDLPRRFARGLHQWLTPSGQAPLEVSAGLGTSPFARIRVAARPEVSLLTLVPTE